MVKSLLLVSMVTKGQKCAHTEKKCRCPGGPESYSAYYIIMFWYFLGLLQRNFLFTPQEGESTGSHTENSTYQGFTVLLKHTSAEWRSANMGSWTSVLHWRAIFTLAVPPFLLTCTVCQKFDKIHELNFHKDAKAADSVWYLNLRNAINLFRV